MTLQQPQQLLQLVRLTVFMFDVIVLQLLLSIRNSNHNNSYCTTSKTDSFLSYTIIIQLFLYVTATTTTTTSKTDSF